MDARVLDAKVYGGKDGECEIKNCQKQLHKVMVQ